MKDEYDNYVENDKNPLFEIIYVSRKYKIEKTFFFKLEDEENGLSVCKVSLGDKHIYVATSQGLGNGVHRKKHIDKVYSLSSKLVNIIYAGDTNILDQSQDKLINKGKGWIDAWEECGTIKNKYTYTDDNNLVKLKIKARPDRVLYYSKNHEIGCEDYDIVGGGNEHISYHYGVLCVFSIN